jgi:hypothetical protein
MACAWRKARKISVKVPRLKFGYKQRNATDSVNLHCDIIVVFVLLRVRAQTATPFCFEMILVTSLMESGAVSHTPLLVTQELTTHASTMMPSQILLSYRSYNMKCFNSHDSFCFKNCLEEYAGLFFRVVSVCVICMSGHSIASHAVLCGDLCY